jgi:hypothetical protein
MAKFSDLDIGSDAIIGKAIEIEELFNKPILVQKTIIKSSKYPGKNSSGLRMQMQVVFAGGDPQDPRSCFTGSDILIGQIQKAEEKFSADKLYPIETTIVKSGKCFQFT